ncbi:MAG: hypothetical protein PUE13_06750 [Clostridiales bacterium]|nr:hypothetical protein [Clostridiales bacterium]
MNSLFISLILVLTVIFIIISADALLSRKYSCIMTFAGKGDDDIECELRELMRKNPKSEIIVVDKTQSAETHTVLEKLEQDFPEIHIISV